MESESETDDHFRVKDPSKREFPTPGHPSDASLI
jgi:hypothetical protein